MFHYLYIFNYILGIRRLLLKFSIQQLLPSCMLENKVVLKIIFNLRELIQICVVTSV